MTMRWLCCVLPFLVGVGTTTALQKDDVIVVGGGLSGLAATLELEKLGYSTTLVEATTRLGGRVASHSSHVELGGTYLHGSNNSLSRLIRDYYKLPTVVSGGASAHPGKESAVWMFEGKVLDKTATETKSTALYQAWLERVQVALKNYSTTADTVETVRHLSAISEKVVNELARNSSLDRALLNFELQMGFEHDLGVPFSQLSVEGLYNNWDWVDHDGPDQVLKEGLGSLIEAMKNDIQGDVFLDSPVERISYFNETCSLTLENSNQVLTSSACIVTIPLGVLRQHHKTLFDPPLPIGKQQALARAGVAAYNTLVLTWSKPLCKAGAYYPLNDDVNNPLASGFVCPQVLRTSITESHVTQFYISGANHPFQDERYWKQQSVQVMNQVFAHEYMTQDDIVDYKITSWHEHPFTLGSYSAPTSSTRGNVDRAILQESIDNVVFFAGEHTHTCGRYQSLDGAYDTGIFAARKVAQSRSASLRDSQHAMTCDEKNGASTQMTR